MTRAQQRQQEWQRRQLPSELSFYPTYVVWELTLRCDQACLHCGSRAQHARSQELNCQEALAVVEQLAALGTREVVLIGGEAYLHRDFLTIVMALAEAGMTPVMTSGGMGITPVLARDMASAGLKRVSISIDGLAENHRLWRRRRDGFQQTTQALLAVQAAGMDASANTHFNRCNQADLEGLYQHLLALGVGSWQVQITAALGRAADHPEWLFQPWDLLTFVPRVAALKRQGFRDRLLLMPGNNLGYFGPEEALLRSSFVDGSDYFQGCQAGRYVMGIESHGAIKGCPSLPSQAYVGGNVRSQSIADIWQQSPVLALRREPIPLWGFCATCPFAETCQGGCMFTTHALLGRPGNNPYCHFRVRSLAQKGRRERVVPISKAPGLPFDHGQFSLVEEAWDTPDPWAIERPLRMSQEQP